MRRTGNTNRRTSATDANATSSRSHAVLQIIMKQSWNNSKGREVTRESRVNLIDLAGSERAGKTNNRGKRLQEGANINRSLLALANCINALAQGTTRKNAKYRDSKLTHLLKSSLEGQCKLIIIANINPSDQMFEDSHNTLKYANRAKCMKIDPKVVRLRERDMAWPEREKNIKRQAKQQEKDNVLLKKQVEALQQMLNGNCPVLPNNGLDVLENLKLQVAEDNDGGSVKGGRNRVPSPPSPTHSCPGARGGRKPFRRAKSLSSASSVASLDSGAVKKGGRSSQASKRGRRAYSNAGSEQNLMAINEDHSIKGGEGKWGDDVKVEDVKIEDVEVNEVEYTKLPNIKKNGSEKNLMDMSDISDISAHESVAAQGFDENAPIDDRVGALESRVTDMAASRKVMLDFISHLQAQKDDAESEREQARIRAERAEREILEQRAMVDKLMAQVELERANAKQAQKDREFSDMQRKAVLSKTGVLSDDIEMESEGVIPEPLNLSEISKVGSAGPSTDVGASSSRTPPLTKDTQVASDHQRRGRPVTGGRRIVKKSKGERKERHQVREAFGETGDKDENIDSKVLGVLGEHFGGSGNGNKGIISNFGGKVKGVIRGVGGGGGMGAKVGGGFDAENADPFSIAGVGLR